MVKAHYGDNVDALKLAYVKALIDSTLQKNGKYAFYTKDLSKGDAIPAEEHKNTVTGMTLREAIKNEVAAKLPQLTVDNMDEFIEHVQEDIIHDQFGLDHAHCVEKGHDVAITEYICYSFFTYVQGLEIRGLYFDDQLASVDVAIAEKVAAVKAEIQSKLPANYNAYDVYELVLKALSSTENSVYDFTNPLATKIEHVYASSANKEKDVLDYYIYELLNSFAEHEQGVIAPGLSLAWYEKNGQTLQDKNKYADFIEALEERLTEKGYIKSMIDVVRSKSVVGALPNYAMSALEGDLDIDAIVEDMYDALADSKKLSNTEKTEEYKNNVLIPELKDYLAYKYYMAVFQDRLKIMKQPEFHVSEVYSGNLAETTNELEALMIHFVTDATDMTEADVRLLYANTAEIEEETEDEESRYLSDDGRIVAVTYGDKNSDGTYSAYKTFILNYNNFAVSVEYAEVTYTIPAYGKVIVMH
jgi:hypothetical protein